jgi:hypothetical protein
LNRQPVAPFAFDFFEPLPIRIEVFDAPLSSDAGLLPLRQFDQRIGVTSQFNIRGTSPHPIGREIGIILFSLGAIGPPATRN